MTNLYDFLSRVLNDATSNPPYSVNMTAAEIDWLKQYLSDPGVELHFKARQVGEKNGEPVYAQDYAVAGDGVDIFSLLTEAMLQNGQIADLVIMAANFYKEHVPNCPDCSKRHFGQEKPAKDWTFKPHKPIE